MSETRDKKEETNIFKQCRLRAAEKDSDFSSAERAVQTGRILMSRERLLQIEQSDPGKKSANPNFDDIINMAHEYNAPELCDYYCTHYCPIGQGKKALEYSDINRISVLLMSSTHFLKEAENDIYKILADGQVSPDESKAFSHLMDILLNIAYSAQSLELWARKKGLKD